MPRQIKLELAHRLSEWFMPNTGTEDGIKLPPILLLQGKKTMDSERNKG